MNYSVCIPLYNKANSIVATLKSIEEAFEKFEYSYEIVITNNCSTDISAQDLEKLVSKYRFVKLYHLPATISLPDNWGILLKLASGDIIKYQLADDLMPNIDLNNIFSLINRDFDYVVGKTSILVDSNVKVAVSEKNVHLFFEKVNQFRSDILSNGSINDKINDLFKFEIHKGINYFGDINPYFFSKRCVPVLTRNIEYLHPTFRSFPDLEMAIKLLINFKGNYISEIFSVFNYNSSSSLVKSNFDKYRDEKVFNFMSRIFLFELLLDPEYKEIKKNLSLRLKFKMLLVGLKRIIYAFY
jgi:glycosyltransferase involved in cell wall biosynthesis